MPESLPRLATIGEVAAQLHIPLHRIEYVLRTRPHIQPRAVAGLARCFDDKAIAQIKRALDGIAARRMGADHDER